MALVPAYDTRTGQKLPHFVPEHHIDHPILGVHLSREPVDPQKSQKSPTAKRAANGDNTEEEK